MAATSCLLPTLPDLFNKRVRHSLTDLQGGDQLHLTAAVCGFRKGEVLPLYGCCVHRDPQGLPICVIGYVRGGLEAVAYDERDARRYPTPNQREQWFGAVLMFLTEIDLTEYADCLRLERLSPALTPLVQPDIAVPLRLAA